MATEIAVEFEADGRKLRAVVNPNGPVRAILIGAEPEREKFAQANGLKRKRMVPPGVRVLDPAGKDVTEEVRLAGFGPGVCYMVGFELICW